MGVQPIPEGYPKATPYLFKDPWGHEWTVATHVEDVTEEEMGRRVAEFQQS